MSQIRNSEKTIQNILEVSSALFNKKGYEQTTIEDIVKEMGTTRGAFYHHFKSKEEVLHALSKQNNYEEIVMDIRNTEGLTGLEKLRKLLAYSLNNSFSEENRHMTQGILLLLENPRILSEHVKDLQNDMAVMVKPFVEEGMQDGSIEPGEVDVLTEFILLLCSFWLMPTIYPGDKEYIKKKVTLIKTVLDALGCRLLDDNLFGYIVTISEFSDLSRL